MNSRQAARRTGVSAARTFSTAEVAAKTGASLRILQWLDEQGVVVPLRGPARPGGGRPDARLYSAADIAYILRLQAARSTYQLRLNEAALLLDCGLRVQVITEPTRFGDILVVPKRRDRWARLTVSARPNGNQLRLPRLIGEY